MKRSPINRRSKKKAAADKVYARTRVEALERDGYECRAVGQVGEMSCSGLLVTHHVLPRSQGGGHEVENLLSLCDAHHRFVHANPIEATAAGWLSHSWENA